MKRIAIVTDSAASVPPELAREVGLEIVPIGIQIDNQFLREGIDITPEEFYRQLENKENITTSQPSPGDFLDVYNRLVGKAKEIISIHITSKQSGTVQVAELLKAHVPIRITVVDSESASMGQGFIALAAARAALLGKSREEILEVIKRSAGKSGGLCGCTHAEIPSSQRQSQPAAGYAGLTVDHQTNLGCKRWAGTGRRQETILRSGTAAHTGPCERAFSNRKSLLSPCCTAMP